MRYAVTADVHGNLEAFRAVSEALAKEGIVKYLFVGDLIGYGADPKACIELMRSIGPEAAVAGNHEWGTLGLFGLEFFNEAAREAVRRTTDILDEEEKDYLRSFELVYDGADMCLVHGTLDSPEEFRYIFYTEDARRTFELMKTDLCFIGHSHVAGVITYDGGKIDYLEGPALKVGLESGKKYVVNVGSVGQPRDLDPRASCAVYDSEERSVEIKRIGYDIETAQDKILKAGFPKDLALRLSEGR